MNKEAGPSDSLGRRCEADELLDRCLGDVPAEQRGTLRQLVYEAMARGEERSTALRQPRQQDRSTAGGEHDERFQRLFAVLPDPVMVLDAETLRFIDANAAATGLYGYSRDEFLQLTPCDISAEPEDSLKSIQQTLAGSRERVPVRWHRRKDGTLFPVELSVGTVHWDGRTVILGVVRDVTERQRRESSVRESEAKFRTLAEQSPNMIFINHRGRVVYTNPKCEALLGYTREEFYAPEFDFRCLIAAEHKALIEASHQRHLRGTDTESVEYAVITKDGRRIDVIMTTNLVDYQGEKAILGIVTDISALKRTEAELRHQRTELQTILDHCPANIFRKDRTGAMTFVNRALAEMVGRPADMWVGKTVFDLHSRALAEQYDRDDQAVMTSGRPRFGVLEPIKSTTGIRWLRTDKIPVRNEQGSVTGLIGFSVDVTERRRAVHALRESEQKYRELAEKTSDIPYSMSIDGRMTYVGPQVARYGLDRDDVVGTDFLDQVLPKDRGRVATELQRHVGSGEVFPVEFRIKAADGRIYWLEAQGTLQRDAEGKPVTNTGVLRDITERKKLEGALAKQAAQQRQRFGRDLHDGLCQELTGLGFLATALRKGLEAREDPGAESARTLTEGLQRAINSTRRIAKGLVPVEVDAGGLPRAIEQLVHGVGAAQHGTVCRFHCPRPVRVHDMTVATELFHIAQEAVTNAARHGQANRIDVELKETDTDDGVVLTVFDDGLGLPADLSHMAGMGLRIMEYRAGLIGAAFEISSVEGEGTKITCTLGKGGE